MAHIGPPGKAALAKWVGGRQRGQRSHGAIAPRTQQQTAAAAVGYLRRSTDRQEQSIGDQKRSVEQYAAEQGLRLIDFYTDDAISGTSSLGRKAFQKMIADGQRPDRPFGIIVVYDVKRFGRVGNDEAGYDSGRHCCSVSGTAGSMSAAPASTGGPKTESASPQPLWSLELRERVYYVAGGLRRTRTRAAPMSAAPQMLRELCCAVRLGIVV